MKALVGAFNQEEALVRAFSVIVQPVVEPMEHYTALILIEPVCFSQVSGPSEVCPGSAATLVISDMKGFGRGRADIVWSHEG